MDARTARLLIPVAALVMALSYGARRWLAPAPPPPTTPAKSLPVEGDPARWEETQALERELGVIEALYPSLTPEGRALYHPQRTQAEYEHFQRVLEDARTPVRWRRYMDALTAWSRRIRLSARSGELAETESLGRIFDRVMLGASSRFLEDARDVHFSTLDVIGMGATARFDYSRRSEGAGTRLDLRWTEVHEAANKFLKGGSLWEPGFPECLFLLRATIAAGLERHAADEDLETVTRIFRRRKEGPWKTRFQRAALALFHKARLHPRELCRLKAEYGTVHFQRLADPRAALSDGERAELAAELAGTNARSKLECGDRYLPEDEAQLERLLELVRQNRGAAPAETIHQLWRGTVDLDAMTGHSPPGGLDAIKARMSEALAGALAARGAGPR